MAPHKQQTIKRVQNFKRVFVLQDSTELNYSGPKEKEGVGPKKNKDERRLLLHLQLVISDSGVCLGVYDDYQWFRTELKTENKSHKEICNDVLHKKHVTEKKTWRWVEGYNKATELASACPDTHVISVSDRVISVSDREGDF